MDTPYTNSLYSACLQGAPLETLRILYANEPESIKGFVQFCGNGSLSLPINTPLHAACQAQCPYETILFLLSEYSDAASCKNMWGETPLHLAAKSSSLDVIELLIEHNPGALAVQDYYGRFPLQKAASSNTLEVVKVIYQAYTDALNVDPSLQLSVIWNAEDVQDFFNSKDMGSFVHNPILVDDPFGAYGGLGI